MRTLAGFISSALIVALTACASAPPPVPEPRPDEPPPVQPPPVEPPREASLRVGVVVSSTGSAILRQYSSLIVDGARVGATAAGTARRAVELVVHDDGGTTAGAARAVRELEQAGVRVIIGPLTDEALAAAARARASDDLLLISPTATSDPAAVRNVYALNVVDARGAAALGEFARRYARVGVLYSLTVEGRRHARAFTEAYGRGGHGTLTDVPFGAGVTNVVAELRRLADARVQALYFPASDRELQLILPQLDYAGLTGVQLMGGENWTSDAARSMPQRVLQGAIIATPLFRESSAVAWQEFVTRYEASYRRTLENPIPALGYDAALLGARAAAGASIATDAFRAATGVLTVRGDSVTRRPFLVRIDGGRLVPVN
ncbi:MAG TPA: penicillin-binding protein activator [Longimicrobiales bacterium]|nr:penicillin-binding protein activator [Longimicrobiales bacterium]